MTDKVTPAEYAAALREMADWVEEHPQWPMPYGLVATTYPTPGAHGQIEFATWAALMEAADSLGLHPRRHGDHFSTEHEPKGLNIRFSLVWFDRRLDRVSP